MRLGYAACRAIARGLVADVLDRVRALGDADRARAAGAPDSAPGIYHRDLAGRLREGQVIRAAGPPGGVAPSELAGLAGLLDPAMLSDYGARMLWLPSRPDADERDLRTLLVDLAFEAVRLRRYPDRPSRFACLYAAESLSFLGGSLPGEVYELEAPGAFRASSTTLTRARGAPLPAMLALAESYWRGDPDPLITGDRHSWELLCPLPVRVARKVPVARTDGRLPAGLSPADLLALQQLSALEQSGALDWEERATPAQWAAVTRLVTSAAA
jgi:hypothetical protein